MFKLANILVPTDFSDVSLSALDEATRLARQFGANIHLLHVQPEHDEAVKASKRLADLQNRYTEFSIYRHLRSGQPAHEIQACADEIGADLITLAAHGRPGLALGSVAEEVFRTSQRPVLTVRNPALQQ